MLGDVLERTMHGQSVSRNESEAIEQAPKAVKERAAKAAVSDVSMHVRDIKDLTLTPHQAANIQEAFRLALLKDISGAKRALDSTGLDRETLAQVIKAFEGK